MMTSGTISIVSSDERQRDAVDADDVAAVDERRSSCLLTTNWSWPTVVVVEVDVMSRSPTPSDDQLT